MRNKLSKILRGVLLSLLSFVNFIYAKAVHAMVIYAPPEVLEREERINILIINFVKEYAVLIIFIFLLAIVGLISIVRILLLKILRKKKQNQNIQSQKPTDELSRQ